MRLAIRDICPLAITAEDGQTVFDRITPALKQGETVDIDFQGVRVVAAPFFHAGFGQLLRDFTREDLRRLVKLENLSPDGRDAVRQVIDNAEKYYVAPEAHRERQRQIMEAVVEDR